MNERACDGRTSSQRTSCDRCPLSVKAVEGQSPDGLLGRRAQMYDVDGHRFACAPRARPRRTSGVPRRHRRARAAEEVVELLPAIRRARPARRPIPLIRLRRRRCASSSTVLGRGGALRGGGSATAVMSPACSRRMERGGRVLSATRPSEVACSSPGRQKSVNATGSWATGIRGDEIPQRGRGAAEIRRVAATQHQLSRRRACRSKRERLRARRQTADSILALAWLGPHDRVQRTDNDRNWRTQEGRATSGLQQRNE